MQINLHDNRIKNGILYLGWILFFACLFFRGCSNGQEKTKTIITIPKISNQLPTSTVVKHEKIKDQKKTNKDDKKILIDLSEDEQRIIAYQEEIDNMQSEFMGSDSIKQAELYRLATELKSFESQFEDENLKLTINGIIAGNEVKEITPTYTIKEKQVKTEIKQKEVKFRMLVGGGLGNSLTFDKPLFNANVGFQNAKGNILRFSFDTEQRIMVGYDFSLFKISK